MKILNIYGQESWHTDAKIIGNTNGLLELKATIEKALQNGKSTSIEDDCLFASDGEGYQVIVECHDDQWGCLGPADSFWNIKENAPQYLILVREELREE